MIHQPLGGARGQATDIAIQAEQIMRIKRKMNELLSKHTARPSRPSKRTWSATTT